MIAEEIIEIARKNKKNLYKDDYDEQTWKEISDILQKEENKEDYNYVGLRVFQGVVSEWFFTQKFVYKKSEPEDDGMDDDSDYQPIEFIKEY